MDEADVRRYNGKPAEREHIAEPCAQEPCVDEPAGADELRAILQSKRPSIPVDLHDGPGPLPTLMELQVTTQRG